MHNKYFLFYSNQCPHSKELVLNLQKLNLLDKFVKVDVSILKKIPSSIKSVPTIIVPDMQEPLEGDKAFFWVEHCSQSIIKREQGSNQQQPQNPHMQSSTQQPEQQPTQKQQSPMPYLPYEMSTSKSDKFSFINGSTQLSHNYSFIHNKKKSNNNTPQFNVDGGGDGGGGIIQRQESAMEKLMKERDNDPSINKPLHRM